MKDPKHNFVYGWTGASQDAPGMLRGASAARTTPVSPQDMVKN